MKLIVNELKKVINHRTIIEDVSFTVNHGEIVGVIGRNGVGKTTLFKAMTGIYLTDNGRVLIDNQDLTEDIALKQELFFVDPLNNFYIHYTPMEIAKMYAITYPKMDVDQFLTEITDHNLPLNQKVKYFSKGMQGLFNVLLALATQAQFVILDEPFDGLDVLVRENVKRLLINAVQSKEISLIISSHNLAELDTLVDRAIILKDTKVVGEYSLENLRETARKIQLVFKDGLPDEIKQAGTLVEARGRVYVMIFENYTRQLDEKIANLAPLLYEELPLSLEDLFRTQLVNENDYILEK
ncbi:ATP-binding cassette domain-containing protein [Periweissella ghanensis]|uniref:ABC transporter ATP-binding protein YtrB n=1 Tax=Periweissella ghanensis TaxID=467997 RepID=A0ABN8BNY9_9LACO|nr:ABC transporter ATP-binding protein [Periweissella ghanensis]MCM0600582.1 ABC transporter ATP-binding protein [Periweissella ghanensis]CAH0418335.1 ABC transporter ATP-binding protein YtrB [Periweissella ghanensis]